MNYLLSLLVGLGVGVAYGLLGVRSPAPPVIALLGLLGMLAGEAAVSYWRGHPDTLAHLFHTKSFVPPGPAKDPAPALPGALSGTALRPDAASLQASLDPKAGPGHP